MHFRISFLSLLHFSPTLPIPVSSHSFFQTDLEFDRQLQHYTRFTNMIRVWQQDTLEDLPQPDPLNHATEHAFMKKNFHFCDIQQINQPKPVHIEERRQLPLLGETMQLLGSPLSLHRTYLHIFKPLRFIFFKPIHTIASNCLDCSKISRTALQKFL